MLSVLVCNTKTFFIVRLTYFFILDLPLYNPQHCRLVSGSEHHDVMAMFGVLITPVLRSFHTLWLLVYSVRTCIKFLVHPIRSTSFFLEPCMGSGGGQCCVPSFMTSNDYYIVLDRSDIRKHGYLLAYSSDIRHPTMDMITDIGYTSIYDQTYSD